MQQTKSIAIRIALIYAATTALWIGFSDRILDALIDSPNLYSEMQTVKGLLYTLCSAALIYSLIRRESAARIQALQTMADTARHLEDSQSWASQLFKDSPLPMWIYDSRSLAFMTVNDAALLHYGYTLKEFKAMTIMDIRAQKEVPVLLEHISRLADGLSQSGQWQHRRKDGSIIDVDIISHSIVYQNRPARFIVANDITERKKMETALLESERRLSEILESVDAHIYLKDTNGCFLFANRPVRELFGVSLEQIVGQSDERFFDAETSAQIRNNDRLVLENGETSKKEETALNLKDGNVSTFLSYKIPLRDKSGKIYALCGISTDITERKQAEALTLNSLHQLEEKEQAKTRFLAAAGHDLRQPIAAANLFVDALKDTAPTPRQSELIERLDQSMSIFSNMLERLLDISKFDAGMVKPTFTSFDLSVLKFWLQHNFEQPASDKQLQFSLSFPDSSALIVRTDIGLLQSVLMNLVSNALKFTERGSILIRARLRNDQIVLQVWDSGIGIAKENLPHIYDEFYQASNPQRNRERGLGLGLSIAKRAMTLLGGTITCRSRLGRGSLFEISLPLHAEQYAIAVPAGNSAAPAITNEMLFNGKRVTIIEDDELVAQGMIKLLEGMGAEVLRFLSAEEALRHADIEDADYYIVDYMLEGALDGMQFLSLLHQRLGRSFRAVLITGDTSAATLRLADECNWPVVNKPLNKSKLISCLSLN